MRQYAKAFPGFWTGKTGKEFRALGRDAQVLGFYLYTNPHAHHLGLYYLPLPTVVHETGMSLGTIQKLITKFAEMHYAYYDTDTEYIWVVAMAQKQVLGDDEQVNPNDKQWKGLLKEVAKLRSTVFYPEFFERYRSSFLLLDGLQPPSQAHRKPIASPSQAHRSTREERQEKREETTTSADTDPEKGLFPDGLVNLYNEKKPPECPTVTVLTAERHKRYQHYLRQFPTREFWEQAFVEMWNSPKLRGKHPSPGHESFVGSLDWLCSKGQDGVENAIKTQEGKYRGRQNGSLPNAPGCVKCASKDPHAKVNHHLRDFTDGEALTRHLIENGRTEESAASHVRWIEDKWREQKERAA